jgi:cell division protein FtsN
MVIKKTANILLILSYLLIISCSASTGSRYESDVDNEKKTESEKNEEKHKTDLAEDFDMSPYQTKIEIEEKQPVKETITHDNLSVWYEYEEPDTTAINERIIIGKEYGYRVQVFTTDNLEEADSLRSDVYFNAVRKDVYVVFDPPFYKVLVGDFKQLSDAKNLSFRLNQMGYTESRVVSDTVNVFQQ